MQILDAPIMSPGTCALCGSAGGDHRKFIDFGKQIDWYGNVYFCTTCIAEVLDVMGYHPVANFDRLHDSYRELNVRYDKIQAENESVKSALHNLLSSSNSCKCSLVDSVSDTSHEGAEDPEPKDVGFSDAPVSGSTTSEQSTNIEGSDDLFDASDFE
ncbi:hypothetical protein [Chitinophaga sp.]|uniref:hypothetical protein n=1 Tax=Chitinophaga sp. TaxID=1869181 RepID=UPI002F958C13